MSDGRVAAIVGRRQEKELLTAALVRAHDGRSGSAVLLRGEAGVGKSTLLDWAEREAAGRGFTVLRAVGAEAETGLAFGALHQAFRSVLQGFQRFERSGPSGPLSEYQRNSLESALGVRAGTPSGFAVGAAVLTLVEETARSAPVLLVLDDLHWIDSSSAAVFDFVHRRSANLPLVIVGATRPEGTGAHGWPGDVVDVPALDSADSASLLGTWYPGLAASTRERVLADAAGNPLALTELPRRLEPAQRAGTAPLPECLPLGGRLERIFAEHLRRISPEESHLLLLGALVGGGDLAAVWQRIVADGAGRAAWERVERTGLARLDEAGRLVFRHPLIRTAVVAAASDGARRRAHRTLAAALAPDDPRGLHHEAAAALFPDEDLAGRLQAAGRALGHRGGDAEGALLLERAAVLSPGLPDRTRRLAWAAVMSARGGRLRHAAALVRELERSPVPPDADPLLAYAVVYADQSHHIAFASSTTSLPAVLDALTVPGADTFGGLTDQAYFKLLLAATYTDDPWAWRALERHRDHASEAGRLCLRAWTDPGAEATAELLGALDGMTEEQEAGSAWMVLWTLSALDCPERGLWRRFAGLDGYATQGSVAKAKSREDFLLGHWDQAAACLREAEIADELGYHLNALLFRQYHAHFLAGRGDEAGLGAVEDAIVPVAARAGMRFVLDRMTYLRGLAALAHRRYEEAYARFHALTPPGAPRTRSPWPHSLIFDLVTAAVHTGREAEARARVEACRQAGSAGMSDRHAFLLAAASALVAGEDEAEASFRAAYAVPGAEQWAFDLARLRLAHGSWLRRRHRPEAGEHLREAHRVFLRLRAAPWASGCEEELRAVEHPSPAADRQQAEKGELTGQEMRIARLAATGLTNREIGRQLRLSPRTIGAHLYRIFPKLGITSRAALAHALDGR
ncbi:AAA family ATPase [Streptomyces sp. NPDC048717]|uniref:AAA family ATPase n=1 Tax=Streptomyces sp. NPDC048717 TaxID=3154928 RepID=UPI0034140A9F